MAGAAPEIAQALQMAGALNGGGGGRGAGGSLTADPISGVVLSLTSTLTSLANPLGGLNLGLGQLRGGLDALLGPTTQFVGGIRAINQQFVSLFDPASVKLFDRAVNDLYATIGEWLTPVTKLATTVVRELGATFNGLGDYVRPLIDRGLAVLRPLLADLTAAGDELLGVLAPLGRVVGEVLVEVFRAVADAASYLARGLAALFKDIREFLGLPAFQPKDAAGKAVTNSSQTSVQGYLTQLQLGALRAGRAEENRPEVKSANYLEKIYTYFAREFVGDAEKAFVAAVRKLPGVKQAQDAADAAGNAAGGLKDFGAAGLQFGLPGVAHELVKRFLFRDQLAAVPRPDQQ